MGIIDKIRNWIVLKVLRRYPLLFCKPCDKFVKVDEYEKQEYYQLLCSENNIENQLGGHGKMLGVLPKSKNAWYPGKESVSQTPEEKSDGRKELEKMYPQDDCMLDCALCGKNERPSLDEPFCSKCRKRNALFAEKIL